MKMAISFILLAALLCTCIPVYAAETTGFPEITVMSQVAGLDEAAQFGWFDKSYNAVFCFNGRFFRVIAKVNETTVEKLNAILCAIRYDDPDSCVETDTQANELGLSLPVDRIEDITGAIKTPEELAATSGKTLSQLEEEDYRCAGEMISDDGTVILSMVNGLFMYDFVMAESADAYRALSEGGDCGALTVKSSSLAGLSPNALDLRYHADGTHDPVGDTDLEIALDDSDILEILFSGSPEDAG